MKKWIALLLAALLLLSLCTAHGEESVEKYDKLVVGTGTAFNGNFLSNALGNNSSDQDVQKLIHGYNLVYLDNDNGAYQFNSTVITAAYVSEDGLTYTFALTRGLTYNDGTPITARDYAFSLLLQGSPALRDVAGTTKDLSWIRGGKAYQKGQTPNLEGLRVLGEYQLSLTFDKEFSPYFYEMKAMDICPLPIGVIAPGCAVKDNTAGAFIQSPGDDGFSAANLMASLALEDGYISHPTVTSGPYMLTEFDGTSATMVLNERYAGDPTGGRPSIPKIIFRVVDPDDALEMLGNGELDLVVRCVRYDQIQAGMDLVRGNDYAMKAYSRTGLSFISFCAEKGPTADINVRKAIAMCMDNNSLASMYLGAFGMPVKGYYGIGQWMFLMANGTMIPEEGQEEEWADLKMDRITGYRLDPEEAGRLLDEAGWILTEKGDAYDPAVGGIRAMPGTNALIPLRLKMIYPEGNGTAPLLKDTFLNYLEKVGIGLELEEVPFDKLLKKYYGMEERDCDMILLGTNFGEVFDPSTEYDAQGTSRLNGIRDEKLLELAVYLRSTEPGNMTEYCRRWLAYIQQRNEMVPEIPLYSNAYLDFHVVELQKYEPARTGCWADAVQTAILSDYVPEEEEETSESAETEAEGEIFDE